MEACGFSDVQSIPPSKFFRRVDEQSIMSFEEIYFKRENDYKEQQRFRLLLN